MRKTNDEIVIEKAWNIMYTDAELRGFLPIVYPDPFQDYLQCMEENYEMEILGMRAFATMHDLGCHDVIARLAINPPAHWPDCPHRVYHLARRSKTTDLLFFVFWTTQPSFSPDEPRKLHHSLSSVKGSIETYNEILRA